MAGGCGKGWTFRRLWPNNHGNYLGRIRAGYAAAIDEIVHTPLHPTECRVGVKLDWLLMGKWYLTPTLNLGSDAYQHM